MRIQSLVLSIMLLVRPTMGALPVIPRRAMSGLRGGATLGGPPPLIICGPSGVGKVRTNHDEPSGKRSSTARHQQRQPLTLAIAASISSGEISIPPSPTTATGVANCLLMSTSACFPEAARNPSSAPRLAPRSPRDYGGTHLTALLPPSPFDPPSLPPLPPSQSTLIKETLFVSPPPTNRTFAFSVSHTTRRPRAGEVDGGTCSFEKRSCLRAFRLSETLVAAAELCSSFSGIRALCSHPPPPFLLPFAPLPRLKNNS